jgi:hypothetical protein
MQYSLPPCGHEVKSNTLLFILLTRCCCCLPYAPQLLLPSGGELDDRTWQTYMDRLRLRRGGPLKREDMLLWVPHQSDRKWHLSMAPFSSNLVNTSYVPAGVNASCSQERPARVWRSASEACSTFLLRCLKEIWTQSKAAFASVCPFVRAFHFIRLRSFYLSWGFLDACACMHTI